MLELEGVSIMLKTRSNSKTGHRSITPSRADHDDAPYKADFSLIHKNYVTVREEPNADKVTYIFDQEHIRKTKREEVSLFDFMIFKLG